MLVHWAATYVCHFLPQHITGNNNSCLQRKQCYESAERETKTNRNNKVPIGQLTNELKLIINIMCNIRVDNYTGEAIGTQHYKTLVTDKFSFL